MQAAPADHRERIIMWAFAKLDVAAFVIASAVVCGSALFLLTVALVLKGAAPGMPVGPHLGQLGMLFPGYSVTLAGALAGAAYASIVGGLLGLVIAGVWNLAHRLFLAFIRMRANLATYEMD